MISNKNLIILSLLTSLISPIEPIQIPFLSNQQQPTSSSSVFQLQQAVHITTHHNRRLRLRRIFNDTDRELIDIQSINIPSLNKTSTHHYPSSHSIKLKTGKIWTHHSTLNQWKLAHQRQILIDQSLKNPSISDLLTKNITLMNSQLRWAEFETVIPDVTDIETLASLAMMTNNAYTLPGEDRWYDPGDMGISIKGTSAGLLGNGGSTGVNDKLNDNLFFSCCCARVSWSWSPVCDCYEAPYKCRASCVESALMNKSVYFQAAVDLYDDIVRMYPHSQIWLAGHSLGGALAGILGVTFGIPAVGFESPGDLLPAKRLHLPLPPGASFGKGSRIKPCLSGLSYRRSYCYGNCNGALSSCSVAGYALETRCHLGKSIIFVIEKVLRPDWIPDSSSSSPSDCRSKQTVEPTGLRWPWTGRKDKGSAECPDEEDDEPIVPIAQPQECEEGDCPLWEFRDSWD
ncbi:hypothetical protein H4Q26_001888 [Puccinia striiformis f. sp. tritici PST-130]|nr:hypothetical protein H4Q26_001888 [Puccinia striiformis f. sp. tritici PST-130]